LLAEVLGLEDDLCRVRLGLDHVLIEQRLGKIGNLLFGDLGCKVGSKILAST
jgi:hypothetical protein